MGLLLEKLDNAIRFNPLKAGLQYLSRLNRDVGVIVLFLERANIVNGSVLPSHFDMNSTRTDPP